MKVVSFKVAKAIKEAGYPQGNTENIYICLAKDIFKEGALVNKTNEYINANYSFFNKADAPTYIDVWLWLWREKRIWVQVRHIGNGNLFGCWVIDQEFSDPEEAIIETIEYLVEKDLIK